MNMLINCIYRSITIHSAVFNIIKAHLIAATKQICAYLYTCTVQFMPKFIIQNGGNFALLEKYFLQS